MALVLERICKLIANLGQPTSDRILTHDPGVTRPPVKLRKVAMVNQEVARATHGKILNATTSYDLDWVDVVCDGESGSISIY